VVFERWVTQPLQAGGSPRHRRSPVWAIDDPPQRERCPGDI